MPLLSTVDKYSLVAHSNCNLVFLLTIFSFHIGPLLLNIHLCSVFIVDQDLSHMVDDEAYDYKFVKWMIKEKVN